MTREACRLPPSPTHSQCHGSGQELPPGSANAGWFQPNEPATNFMYAYPRLPNVSDCPPSVTSAALPQPWYECPTGLPVGVDPTLATHAGLLPGWLAWFANFTWSESGR